MKVQPDMPNNIAHQDQHSTGNETENPSAYYLHARPEVLELVPRTACKVLDVGCGAGGLSANLKARQSVEVHGVELVEKAAEHALNHMDRVWNSTIEEALPKLPDGYYDCIVIADVLEHLLDPWTVLADLKKKLAADGKLISSIPNIQNWGVLSELIQGKWDYRSEGILDRTHLRFFTRKSVQELFWNAGLRITNLSTTVSGPVPPRHMLKGLWRSELSANELERDGQVFQFLIEAEVPGLSNVPKVSVVILNWNGRKDTLECLTSVNKLNYPNYEIVVVDNGSTDDSVAAISHQHPNITLLQTGSNLGYAGGNNVGIRWALDHDAEFILVLNNDTIVSPDLLNAFVNAKDLLPASSVLGAKIFYQDNPNKLWFAGGRWNGGSRCIEHIGHNQMQSNEFNRIAEVDYITGCALFASASTFKEVGLLNESFYLTYEETDWCYRAREKRHICIFVPYAELWHKVSASFGGVESPLQLYFYSRNILLWAERHLPRSAYWSLFRKTFHDSIRFSLGTSQDGAMFKRLIWAFSSLWQRLRRDGHDATGRARYLGFRDYLLRRFGDCPDEVRHLKANR